MYLLHIIPILLTLGSQPECDGFGVCILETQTEERTAECLKYDNCIQALLDYTDHEIILTVSHAKIKDRAFVKYFTKENFELDKDYLLSDEVAKSLGCPNGLILPKGNYPINEEDGKIVVRFKL